MIEKNKLARIACVVIIMFGIALVAGYYIWLRITIDVHQQCLRTGPPGGCSGTKVLVDLANKYLPTSIIVGLGSIVISLLVLWYLQPAKAHIRERTDEKSRIKEQV